MPSYKTWKARGNNEYTMSYKHRQFRLVAFPLLIRLVIHRHRLISGNQAGPYLRLWFRLTIGLTIHRLSDHEVMIVQALVPRRLQHHRHCFQLCHPTTTAHRLWSNLSVSSIFQQPICRHTVSGRCLLDVLRNGSVLHQSHCHRRNKTSSGHPRPPGYSWARCLRTRSRKHLTRRTILYRTLT
jgi:hypothetical protein